MEMVSPTAPVPVRVGWLSLVVWPLVSGPVPGPTSSITAPIAGVPGAVRSTVTLAAGERPLVWPLRVAVTSKVCSPSPSAAGV